MSIICGLTDSEECCELESSLVCTSEPLDLPMNPTLHDSTPTQKPSIISNQSRVNSVSRGGSSYHFSSSSRTVSQSGAGTSAAGQSGGSTGSYSYKASVRTYPIHPKLITTKIITFKNSSPCDTCS